jgi:DNA repair protein RadC
MQAVFDASEQELCEVNGIGPSAAALIRLVPQIMRKSAVDRAAEMRCIQSTLDARDYLMPHFLYEQNEVALMLCLDTQNRVIKCVELSRGTVNKVNLDVRMILETALKLRAAKVILAHNHPDSPALNSREDDMVTQQILRSLDAVGITLRDHLIFSRDQFFSYADAGSLRLFMF